MKRFLLVFISDPSGELHTDSDYHLRKSMIVTESGEYELGPIRFKFSAPGERWSAEVFDSRVKFTAYKVCDPKLSKVRGVINGELIHIQDHGHAGDVSGYVSVLELKGGETESMEQVLEFFFNAGERVGSDRMGKLLSQHKRIAV